MVRATGVFALEIIDAELCIRQLTLKIFHFLDHTGFPDAVARILAALEETLASGTKTSDLGGTATTDEMADAVAQRLARSA